VLVGSRVLIVLEDTWIMKQWVLNLEAG